MTTPYTYLIGWPEHSAYYYGVRWRKGCDPTDLWTKYFTSSSYVLQKRMEWGEPTLIEVRRAFSNKIDAKRWEDKVLRRLDVKNHPKFLNRTSLPGSPPEKTPEQIKKIANKLRGKKRSDEQRKNMKGSLGKSWSLSDETRLKMSESAKKRPPKSEQHRKNIAKGLTGHIQSLETREKRRASLTGKRKSPEHIAAMIAAKKKKKEESEKGPDSGPSFKV